MLVGCGGNKNGMQVKTIATLPSEPPDCTAYISWSAPTAREDESPFTVEEVDRYDIFIGLSSGEYYRIIGIEDRYLTQWKEDDLEGGDNWFTMTVTDVKGLESEKAEEIMKLIDTRCTGE